MENNTSKDVQVEEWTKRAEEDLHAADVMLKEGGLPNPACFHAQQSAEKYLKGFLVHKKKWYPKIHTLNALWELCYDLDTDFDEIKKDAVFLNEFYVTARYPGDYPEFSMKDAKDAYDAAVRVRDFVLDKFKEKV